MEATQHAVMAGRLRLVDDVAVFDMAQQLRISMEALLRDLKDHGGLGFDADAEATLLASEWSHVHSRRDVISFLARLTPRATELTRMWDEMKGKTDA